MTIRSAYSSLLGLMAILVALSASLSPARADLYVVESTAAAIKAGSRLATTDTVSIPAGSYIRAVLPSGKTQTIKGPYSGAVADLAKGQARNEGVLTWIRSILETGGSKEATPGATRSIGRETAKVRTGFSWSAVPVTADATVCIEKGAKLQLVRAPSARADHVTVVDIASSERGEAQWEAGSEVAAWPASLTPRPDGTYALLVVDRPRRQVTLRVLDTLPAEGDVLTELHRLGCKSQFEVWVREKLASSAPTR
jgi:hypothetical protein